MNCRHVTVRILFDACAFDEIGAFQPDFAIRLQPEILFRRIFHEVFAFDIEFSSKWDLAHSRIRIFGIVLHFDFFDFSVFPVVDDDFYRVEDRHGPLCGLVQFFADAKIEQVDIDHAVRF